MKHPHPEIETLLSGLANARIPTIDLSLERVLGLLKILGNPQQHLPPVLHVAGTNGKGSLLAYVRAIMEAAGYTVHRYSSPHLVKFNERILLAGSDISDDALLSLLRRVSTVCAEYPVTAFEATTALAFLAFAEVKADILLLETGMGGRLDATNVVERPVLTAITPVSMDHTEFLGSSLTAIAGEKAGILKPGVPCVVGPQDEEVNQLIACIAHKNNSKVIQYNDAFSGEECERGLHYVSSQRDVYYPRPGLLGRHQFANAATAIACIEALPMFHVNDEHIAQGISSAFWPARLQRVRQGGLAALLPEKGELWLDGGHNPAAGVELADWVRGQSKPVYVVCGMLKTKDVASFLAPLAPHVRSLLAVPIEGEGGAQSPGIIRQKGDELGVDSHVMPNIKIAIEHVVTNKKNDFIILICGSLLLAGNALWQNGNHG